MTCVKVRAQESNEENICDNLTRSQFGLLMLLALMVMMLMIMLMISMELLMLV